MLLVVLGMQKSALRGSLPAFVPSLLLLLLLALERSKSALRASLPA
jgi:hypothetical protein